MRHGQAEHSAVNDAARRLTAVGVEQARRGGAHLAQLSLDVAQIFCSPYRRARETAQLVRESLPGVPLVQTDCLAPDADPRSLQRLLDAQGSGTVLCVGHQPLLGYALQWLVDGGIGAGCPFETGSLALLRREFPGPGGAELRWHRGPEELLPQ